MTADEIERLGHALSKVIQHRYCWLVAHAVRGLFLRLADARALPQLPLAYSFSLEDERNGVPPIPLEFILRPLIPAPEPIAQAEDGTRFDHAYIRDITLTALRGSFLAAVQSCLEYHKIADVIAAHAPTHSETFRFLREARNVILHADGIMRKRGLKPCTWRAITIENNGQRLRLSDAKLNALVEGHHFSHWRAVRGSWPFGGLRLCQSRVQRRVYT